MHNGSLRFFKYCVTVMLVALAIEMFLLYHQYDHYGNTFLLVAHKNTTFKGFSVVKKYKKTYHSH